MNMIVLKEWNIRAPWGKIALVSWGNPQGEPVLLVHGRQDSLATFMPLLKFLPDKYHYVGLDLPGNGKSDAMPTGVMITRLSPVSAINIVVKHLKWDNFMCIGHSLGAELALFYNAMNPGQITKLILLDVKPALLRLQASDLSYYFANFYAKYYSNYEKYNVDSRVYSRERATRAVMVARGLSKDQADVILSRNLIKLGDDKYKLSWDMRQKILVRTNFPPEFYIEIFSKHPPPSLYINVRQSFGNDYVEENAAVERIYAALQENNSNMYSLDVDGGHDVHFTNPERIERAVCEFLDKDFGCKSKL